MTERIAGRYEIHSEIAAGGMATVHLGRVIDPIGFARIVAVKRLHPQLAKDPEVVAMLLDEARISARIHHTNVVATLDVVASDGDLSLVMEYLRGETLSRLVRAARAKGERVPPRIAVAIVAGVLHGLHAAHEATNDDGAPLHIVHRDVSPQNVLVGTDGIARVLDFGVAKARGRSRTTRDGNIRGKLGYMAPEQLHGEEVTPRTDLYAASIVLWEALTTTRLFDGETEAEVIAKVARASVTAPSLVASDVPRALDAVVLMGLARQPSARFASARDMALALERTIELASASEVGAWVEAYAGPALRERDKIAAAMPAARAAADARELETRRKVATKRRGERRRVLVAGAAVTVVAAIGIAFARRPDGARAPGPQTEVDLRTAPAVGSVSQTDAPRAVPSVPSTLAGRANEPTAPVASSDAPIAAPIAAPAAAEAVTRSSTDGGVARGRASRKGASGRCDPPYTVDSAGRRHFKMECL